MADHVGFSQLISVRTASVARGFGVFTALLGLMALLSGLVHPALAQSVDNPDVLEEPADSPEDRDDAVRLSVGEDQEAEEPKPEETPEERMDRLFTELKSAPDASEAAFIAEEIEAVWRGQVDPTARLISQRAMAAASIGDYTLARQLADGAIALSNETGAEAYVRSADIALVSDDLARAIMDLESAVAVDPRRYDALLTLAGLFERIDSARGAYEAYGAVLALYPEHEFASGRRDALERDVSGLDL